MLTKPDLWLQMESKKTPLKMSIRTKHLKITIKNVYYAKKCNNVSLSVVTNRFAKPPISRFRDFGEHPTENLLIIVVIYMRLPKRLI